MKRLLILFACCWLALLCACSDDPQPRTKEKNPVLSCTDFSLRNIMPITNYQADSLTHKTILLDYTHAMDGFAIPSVRQAADGQFVFSFELKNNTSAEKKFYYKIFYQNESHKYPELNPVTHMEHEFAGENFYGSWEDTKLGFKETQAIPADKEFHKIEDKIRIVGNPRNEERYIHDGENDRWQRNPRTGDYSFLLVVCSESNLKMLPSYVQDIHEKNNDRFENPYYYFLSGEGKRLGRCIAAKADMRLKVIAKPDLSRGIYIQESRFESPVDRSAYCATCGKDTGLYENAPLQQFRNYVDASTKMDNIPVIADVLQGNYSQMDYNWNKSFYRKDELIPTVVQVARKPCETVAYDATHKSVTIKNPGTHYGEWKKESVGVITRHGFTYGKYRAKVKLTELLNKNGVWNGITNAIWLITQSEESWNSRRTCNKDGYMATYWGGPNEKRIPVVGYSEIDFEILKTPPYCPENTFPPVYKNAQSTNKNINAWNVAMPDEVSGDNKGMITVACTNWDMACHDPKNFSVECAELRHDGQVFNTHRWDANYRALSERKEESDDELFGQDFYYFEIDWEPNEITWRVGKSPDKMRVVGYMNDAVTTIPNNQMLLIISQEFHNTVWWPGTPYAQDKIPFPLNDIMGQVYELTVE